MKIEKEEFDESAVTLDTYDSDLNLVIDASLYSARPITKEGFAFMWAGARATHGAEKQKFCFELKVLQHLDVSHLPSDEPNPHVVRIGFSVHSSSLQLGEDPLSYGYGGTGKISTNCQFKDFGEPFIEGDCILAVVNMESDLVQIGFGKNGNFLGWAYKFNKRELQKKALFPHVLSKNCSFEVNFGQKEKSYFSLPDEVKDYIFIGCLPVDQRISGTRPPKTREDCEIIMMCGLPGAGKSVWAAEYAKKHPEKKYNVLGTNNIMDKMKVMGLPRKRNYAGRWDVLIKMASTCLNKMFEIGSKQRRNYILDQTNVYPNAQRKKMRNFDGFKRIAVVIVPTEEEYTKRCSKRNREEGKEVPDQAVLEMKANFKLPEVNEIFADVIYVELPKEEAEKLVSDYNEEGKAAVGPSQKRFRPNEQSSRFGSDQGRGRSQRNFFSDKNSSSREPGGRFGRDHGRFDTGIEKLGSDSGRFSSDSGRFSSDSGRFGSESRRFGSDHGGFGSDSGRFASAGDHGRFGSDRGRFGSDRGGFGSDRGGFGSDHGGFGSDRGRFGNSHDRFGNDHDRFGNDHDRFGNDHGRFGNDQQGFDRSHGFGSSQGGYGSDGGRFEMQRGMKNISPEGGYEFDGSLGGYNNTNYGFEGNQGGYSNFQGGSEYRNNPSGYGNFQSSSSDGNYNQGRDHVSYDSHFDRHSGYTANLGGFDATQHGYDKQEKHDNEHGGFYQFGRSYNDPGSSGSNFNENLSSSYNRGGLQASYQDAPSNKETLRGGPVNSVGNFSSRGNQSRGNFGRGRGFQSNYGKDSNPVSGVSTNYENQSDLNSYDKREISSRNQRGFHSGSSHGNLSPRGSMVNPRGYNSGAVQSSRGSFRGKDYGQKSSSIYDGGYNSNKSAESRFKGSFETGAQPIQSSASSGDSGIKAYTSVTSKSRTATRWSAEIPQANAQQNATGKQDLTYSNFGATVKTEPPVNNSGNPQHAFFQQGSYGSYGQTIQLPAGTNPTYGYPQNVTNTVIQQLTGGALGTGNAQINQLTPAQPQMPPFYQQPPQPAQYFTQFYAQQAPGTVPAYGPIYGSN